MNNVNQSYSGMTLSSPAIPFAMLLIAIWMLFNAVTMLYAFPLDKILTGKSPQWIGSWLTAQYYASYDLEFLKRGLVASVLNNLNVQINFATITALSLVIINVFIISLIHLSRRVYKDNPQLMLAFLLLFISSPGTAMQMGYDLGRFDVINMLITLLAINLLLFKEQDSAALESIKALIIASLFIIGLLIHEGFLFINAPLLLALGLQRVISGKLPVPTFILVIVVTLLTMGVITLFGDARPETIDSLAASTKALVPEYNSTSSLKVWQRGLADNMMIGIGGLLKPWVIKKIIIASIPLLIYIGALLALVDFNKLSKDYWLILASPLGALPLFLLGADYSRWVGIMMFLIFFVGMILYHDDKLKPLKAYYKSPFLLLAIISVSLLLGPVGVDPEPFPQFNKIPQILQYWLN